jgi:hypothetical protein
MENQGGCGQIDTPHDSSTMDLALPRVDLGEISWQRGGWAAGWLSSGQNKSTNRELTKRRQMNGGMRHAGKFSCTECARTTWTYGDKMPWAVMAGEEGSTRAWKELKL